MHVALGMGGGGASQRKIPEGFTPFVISYPVGVVRKRPSPLRNTLEGAHVRHLWSWPKGVVSKNTNG